MNKTTLAELIEEHGSVRKIAAAVDSSYTNIRYWLRKHGLLSAAKLKPYLCKCGETEPKKFYKKHRTQCRKCFNRKCAIKWQEKKRKAIAFKGGQCEHCGFKTEHLAVYDFHHRQGEEKDLDWPRMRKYPWPRIVEELAKCSLLCANCHRIEHEDDFNHDYHSRVCPLFPKELKG